ncbi:MAG: sulfatase-like hydrolase/transferase, partial [Alphaproteobacteria bacterium]|nr:sulfatase-like hydrolase/transferase [Alphaproteobacteria bacterium]
MNRRTFVLGVAAAGFSRTNRNKLLASATVDIQSGPRAAAAAPNILIIIVDQMRHPKVFPTGVDHSGAFIARFMPKLYHGVWKQGVKFVSHFTAAAPCSPARAALITGLYAHQTWMMLNVDERPFRATSRKPSLDSRFPTYGKLLRAIGYQTPFVGKWHLSPPPKDPPRLDEYGFEGLTYYDPVGQNLQGTLGNELEGYLNDLNIAHQAIAWLTSDRPKAAPWCLTVSFLNPHDIQYFWGGTEFRRYDRLFDNQSALRPRKWFAWNDGVAHPPVDWNADSLKDPPSYGYPELPPNWESAAQLAANKPATQSAFLHEHELGSGGISEDPNETDFTLVPDPASRFGIARAPYSYWQRGLDCYTRLMSIVDARIGEVLAAIPADEAENTIIVFTADHGSYAGAHGFMTGKTGSLYDEAFHVPLVVFDPSGRFTGEIATERLGLTSSVDILPMLVSLAHNGSSSWRSGEFEALYGSRHDLL